MVCSAFECSLDIFLLAKKKHFFVLKKGNYTFSIILTKMKKMPTIYLVLLIITLIFRLIISELNRNESESFARIRNVISCS